ncbi:MAG TPA: glycosyltransferase family 2 protein [Polyangiales bacterium]
MLSIVEGRTPRIAVVIPCFRVSAQVLSVIARIGPEVWRIYVVDDACPEQTGELVEKHAVDARVRVLRNRVNRGVGGAVMAGYEAALNDGAAVMVKIDGDGQMDPALLPRFVEPILNGQADYTKGNRFFDLLSLRGMPRLRLYGNAVLSLMAKVSTGYWTLFDPTNGYTAIDARVASWLRFESLSERYFFETDMLFRLNTLRAVVIDVPMDSVYAGEKSNLRITRILGDFLYRHARNACKRIFYNYFLRDMSAASLELVAGLVMITFGVIWGALRWVESAQTGIPATLGTIMLAVLPVLLGTQLLLGFMAYDVASVPSQVCSPRLGRRALSERPSQRVGPPEEPRRPSASAL